MPELKKKTDLGYSLWLFTEIWFFFHGKIKLPIPLKLSMAMWLVTSDIGEEMMDIILDEAFKR